MLELISIKARALSRLVGSDRGQAMVNMASSCAWS